MEVFGVCDVDGLDVVVKFFFGVFFVVMFLGDVDVEFVRNVFDILFLDFFV